MAGADIQTDLNQAADHAVADPAQAGVEAEQRSFAAARSSLKTGQDLARQATTNAAEFWRQSLTPMSQLFEQMWRQPARMPLSSLFIAPFGNQPPADLRETDKGLELRVELPGLKAEDIDLSLRGDALILAGEKADESSGAAGAVHFSERRFGHFERSFPLPAGADRANIDASFQDGLLRVTIPLAHDEQEETPIAVRS